MGKALCTLPSVVYRGPLTWQGPQSIPSVCIFGRQSKSPNECICITCTGATLDSTVYTLTGSGTSRSGSASVNKVIQNLKEEKLPSSMQFSTVDPQGACTFWVLSQPPVTPPTSFLHHNTVPHNTTCKIHSIFLQNNMSDNLRVHIVLAYCIEQGKPLLYDTVLWVYIQYSIYSTYSTYVLQS